MRKKNRKRAKRGLIGIISAACKIILATYNANGILESIDILPADSSVNFENKAYNGTYKAYLWNGTGPECEDSVSEKYDTLF